MLEKSNKHGKEEQSEVIQSGSSIFALRHVVSQRNRSPWSTKPTPPNEPVYTSVTRGSLLLKICSWKLNASKMIIPLSPSTPTYPPYSGITGMSGVISIRYLGGILCLDTFWLKIHYEDHQSVAKKMFNRIGALLADIGLSTDHTDARNVNLVVVDTEGIDMLVQSTLVGMQLWRQQLNDQQLLLAEWFSYFQNLILLLLRCVIMCRQLNQITETLSL